MTKEDISWQGAIEQFNAARWTVRAHAVKENVCVSLSRGGITQEKGIFVRGPNWIERRFKITFEKKILKAINRQQKECDILNAGIRRTAELDVMAEVMLMVAEMEREGKTIILGDIEKKNDK
jgi:hypothetical protein